MYKYYSIKNIYPPVEGPYGENADAILYVDIVPLERPAQGVDWADKYWKKK